MATVKNYLIAAVAGLSVATFASQAFSQDAAREAAVSKCMKEAQATYPGENTNERMEQRTGAYRACMQKEGHRP